MQEFIIRRLRTTVIPEGVNITGCTRCDDGFFVVDTYNKRLAKLNLDGAYLKDIVKFTNNPLDVCHVDGNIFAVTIPSDHMVAFVDTNECKIVESVVYRPKCYYIASDYANLFIGCPNNSKIITTDKHGRRIRSLNIPGERFAVASGNIYITNENEDLVSCYDKYGNQKWIAPDIVRNPIGIAVSHDFLTVLSKHNAVYTLSRDGYQHRNIINTEHGLDDPSFMYLMYGVWCILLVVCNKSNTQAITYQID